MEIFDTHAHFTGDMERIAGVLGRAANESVTRIMAVGGNDELNSSAIAAAGLGGKVNVLLALGADRDSVKGGMGGRDLDDIVCAVKSLIAAQKAKPAALGEIGLDFHYNPETAKEQEGLFARELALADELALPVVIHTREADERTLGILDEVPWKHDSSRGIIHCYTGDRKFARELLDRGFYISISGIVTFRLADNVRDSALYVPDDRILVETDSPFLAPVPLRGKENEPSFIVHTVEFLAKLRGIKPDAFAALTTANAVKLLG